jgi:hypothetical protein
MCDAYRRWEELDVSTPGYCGLERLDGCHQSSLGPDMGSGQSTESAGSGVRRKFRILSEAKSQMLTGSTSAEEQSSALRRLEQGSGPGGKEIRVSNTSRS